MEAIPAAGRVSLDYAGIIRPMEPWIVLYEASSAVPLEPLKRPDLAARIRGEADPERRLMW